VWGVGGSGVDLTQDMLARMSERPAAGDVRSHRGTGAARVLRNEKVRFLLAGGWNTAFGYALFALLVLTTADVVHYTLLLIGTYAVSTVNAFLVYRWFVFRVRGRWVLDLVRFSGVYVVSLGLNLVTLPLLVEGVGIDVLPAQALAVVVTALVSYVAQKRFSFRRRPAV
jgi:putative flippase GtrA